MATIRVKVFHGEPEDIEIEINKWLDDTGNKIDEIDICNHHANNAQVIVILRYKV